VRIGQLLVVQPQRVQQRGMQVRDADHILHGPVAELVGPPVDVSLLEAAARPPDVLRGLPVVESVQPPRRLRLAGKVEYLGDRRLAWTCDCARQEYVNDGSVHNRLSRGRKQG
jgi:hypothetical protein